MTVSEKAKAKLDEAGREIKEAIDNLGKEVGELTEKVKEKLKGAGKETREATEELAKEVKILSKKVMDLIPKRRKKSRLPVNIDRSFRYGADSWEEPFLELRHATDQLFNNFIRSYMSPLVGRSRPWGLETGAFSSDWPRVDMDETDDRIRLTAELPGVDKDNIDISVSDDRITIRGEKKEEEEKKERGFYMLERSYGSFQRSFHLPCEVESDKVDASFKDGVLTVVLPKTAAAKERIKRIPVHSD